VNLSQLNRLDSIGLGLLVRYAERMQKRGGGIRLAGSPPFVETLLNMSKISRLLPSYPTEEEAILSFLKQSPTQEAQSRSGPRVLIVDESADLCVFVRTALTQHGFNVKSTRTFRDAKILLQVDTVDYLLIGHGTPQLSSETVLRSLTALAQRRPRCNSMSTSRSAMLERRRMLYFRCVRIGDSRA
jgi:PleD family two-component response regulator